MPQTTPAANDDSGTPISFPAVGRKKLTAAFDGGRLTSDGGVLLLAQAERSMGICAQLAACIADRRDPARVIHTLPDILRARIFAICSSSAEKISSVHDPFRPKMIYWIPAKRCHPKQDLLSAKPPSISTLSTQIR